MKTPPVSEPVRRPVTRLLPAQVGTHRTTCACALFIGHAQVVVLCRTAGKPVRKREADPSALTPSLASRKTDQKIGLGGRSFFLGFRDRQSARVQHAVQHEKGGARNILIEQCKNDTVHRIANPVSQIRQQIHER